MRKQFLREVIALGAIVFVSLLLILVNSTNKTGTQMAEDIESESSTEDPFLRRINLNLPQPFETVLSMDFPFTKSQDAVMPDGTVSGTWGWEMRVAEIPSDTPSTRKTGFFMGIEEVVVTLGDLKLFCQNTEPYYKKRLVGCRPLEVGKDGIFYEQSEGDWTGKIYPRGTKVEFYVVMNCTRELIDAREPCRI